MQYALDAGNVATMNGDDGHRISLPFVVEMTRRVISTLGCDTEARWDYVVGDATQGNAGAMNCGDMRRVSLFGLIQR
jgi:hypothetical protein